MTSTTSTTQSHSAQTAAARAVLNRIARDLAAAGAGTLKPWTAPTVDGKYEAPIKVDLSAREAGACPAFVGRHFKAQFEFYAHARLAQEAGLAPAIIEAVRTRATVSRTTVASTTRSQRAARRRAIWLDRSVAPRL